MFRFNRAAAGTAVLALTLTACATEDDTFEGIPVFPVDAPEVQLIDAGENPRVLEYSQELEAWDTTVAVSAGIDQSTAAPGQDVDTEAPAGGDVNTTTLPLNVQVAPAPAPAAKEQDATRQVDFEVGSGKHSDLEIGQDVASAEGFLMRWRAGNAGTISTLQLLAPPDAAPRGLQLVEPALLTLVSSSVTLPQEPVGVGGSWSVDNRVAGDATMQRTTTYKVVSVEGDLVTLDVDVEEHPTERTLKIDNEVAGELDGQSVEVESAATTSEGQIVVDLTKPLPVSGQVAATTRLVYSGGNEKARVVQDITRAVKYGA